MSVALGVDEFPLPVTRQIAKGGCGLFFLKACLRFLFAALLKLSAVPLLDPTGF